MSVIRSLAWLGLAVEQLRTSRAFYEPLLGEPDREHGELRFSVAESELRLKPPGADPAGGEHVHFAFSTGPPGYERFKQRLEARGPIEEHDLSVYHSVYAFDPDDHCVEFADREEHGTDIASLFEIVLEVEDLDGALDWYRQFDPRVMDRGEQRRRVRLDMGPFELELWEPQRGLAGARPGRSVDLGLAVGDPQAIVDDIAENDLTETEAGLRITDPDGHLLTFVRV